MEIRRVLDIPRLRNIPLSATPFTQKLMGYLALWPNFRFPPKVEISFENFDRVPNEAVIFAMNHTDRYNYWPFQFQMWQQYGRFTSTWVKGKYYENPAIGKFMQLTNNLPTVSRGYLITRDFLSVMKRAPNNDEYAALRNWVDATSQGPGGDTPELAPEVVDKLFGQARDVFGHPFDPSRETYPVYVNSIFRIMMELFVALNQQARDLGLDILVFPQGTRSIRLIRGHIGLAELAMKFQATVVPVGCNGADLVYPGGSPIGQRGKIVYRVGEPIPYKEMGRFHVPSDFTPFDAMHEAEHRDKLQGYVDVVMDRINELVDPQYQYGDEAAPIEDGERRFV
jgi:1-acyl-sn-glycerol-3-phosphate acyltransferase